MANRNLAFELAQCLTKDFHSKISQNSTMRKSVSRLTWGTTATTLLLLLVILEFCVRLVLGMGNPPLSVAHPKIEYYFAPFQDVHRLGNRFVTNAWGMRSEHFPRQKLGSTERRILVVGDSVVNGGILTDHECLATSIAQRELQATCDSTVIVGNMSAGSWGPGNWLAYTREFGFFDADVLILVINSDDAQDVPLFAPLDPKSHPIRKPTFAIGELIDKLAQNYLIPLVSSPSDHSVNLTEQETSERFQLAMADLEQFLKDARSSVGSVQVIQYLDATELAENKPNPGYHHIRNCCDKLKIPVVSTQVLFADHSKQQLFRDNIHPNLLGHELLARMIVERSKIAFAE